MRVIFLKDVPRVGKKYDVKDVNDGYAMNFLLPRKLAEAATPKAIAELEQKKKNIQIEKEIQTELLLKNLEEIKGKVVTMRGKANEKGSLFQAIHAKEIVDAMASEHHIQIALNCIALDKPIKETGEHEIKIEIPGPAGKNKKSSFKLVVEKM